MEIIPLVAELFRSYGRTDGNDKINRLFRKFCKGPYKIRTSNLSEQRYREKTRNTVQKLTESVIRYFYSFFTFHQATCLKI